MIRFAFLIVVQFNTRYLCSHKLPISMVHLTIDSEGETSGDPNFCAINSSYQELVIIIVKTLRSIKASRKLISPGI